MKKFFVALLLFVGWMNLYTASAWAQQLEWTRQFGSASSDQTFGFSVDASGVYVTGLTAGTLPGQTSAGGTDAFVRKLSIQTPAEVIQ